MNDILLKKVGLAIFFIVGLFNELQAFSCPFKEDLDGTNCRCIESQGNLICEDLNSGLDFSGYDKWPIILNSIIIRNSNNFVLKLENTKSPNLILENSSVITLNDHILGTSTHDLGITNLQVINSSLTPEQIINSENIIHFVYETNKFEDFDKLTMRNLKYLSLKNNKIKMITKDLNTKFASLMYLNLENNHIDLITPYSLNFPNIIDINLSHNNITDDIFDKANLTDSNITLDLSYNNIVEFRNTTFMKYSQNTSKIMINLNYNPIKCNYHNNSWIFISTVRNSIKAHISHVYCDDNLNLLELNENDLYGHPTPKTDEPPTITTPGIKTDLPPVDTTPAVKTDVPPIISTSPTPKTDIPPVDTTPHPKTDIPPVDTSPKPKTDVPPINDQRTDIPPINGQTDIPPTITIFPVVTSPTSKIDVPPINDERTDVPPINDQRSDVPPINDQKTNLPPINDHRIDIPPTISIL